MLQKRKKNLSFGELRENLKLRKNHVTMIPTAQVALKETTFRVINGTVL